jgi:hypothetical protein
MPRLMSVALTTDQVRRREKTVTRRVGWQMIKPGDQVTLCPKVRGRRHGEPLERIVTVNVVSTRREQLDTITPADVAAEGFPDMTPAEFVEFFCATHNGVAPHSEVTRIEWTYPTSAGPAGTPTTKEIRANDSSELTPTQRARQFIDDVQRIYAEHGMRCVESEDAYKNAIKQARKQITSLHRLGKRTPK